MKLECPLCNQRFDGRDDGVTAIDQMADHHNDEHGDQLGSLMLPEEVSGLAPETKV